MQSIKHKTKPTNISFHCMAAFLLNYSSLQDSERKRQIDTLNHHTPKKE